MSYKIIAKNLVKSLRNYLKDHIFPFQAAFIHRRWIIKNTHIAQESSLKISKETRGKSFLMGIKLDMKKSL